MDSFLFHSENKSKLPLECHSRVMSVLEKKREKGQSELAPTIAQAGWWVCELEMRFPLHYCS
jgi:hypothetical protein